jgi:hypothetical protein
VSRFNARNVAATVMAFSDILKGNSISQLRKNELYEVCGT